MSTYWAFVCVSHKPEIRMNNSTYNHGEQHLAELWTQREKFAEESADPMFMGWNGDETAKWFLARHPDCRLVIADEYGHERIFPDRLLRKATEANPLTAGWASVGRRP